MPLEMEEFIKDSPRFRAALDKMETEVIELETKLQKVLRLCEAMVESGKSYQEANRQFLEAMEEVAGGKGTDNVLQRCIGGLREVAHNQMMILDQVERSVKVQLQNVILQDIPRLWEMKKDFDRIREDLEQTLLRNSQVSRHRMKECEESSHMLLATQKCFQHLALDYILQMNSFEVNQQCQILKTVLSFTNSHTTFFHQGSDLILELEPLMKEGAAQLDRITAETLIKQKEMEMSSQLQDVADVSDKYLSRGPQGVAIEGYLFKRGDRNSRTWSRHWFSIQKNQLVSQRDWKERPVTQMEDLRLCSVRALDEAERRFCFEVISVHRTCTLQADSEPVRQAWFRALSTSIDTAFREPPDTVPDPERSEVGVGPWQGLDGPRQEPGVLEVVSGVPGNERCCDCGRESPRWACANLGVTLCIECSGIHRSLGVHLSKVRSLTLDSWEPEALKLFCALGNNVVNSIYEGGIEEAGERAITAESPRQVKELWIKSKYVEKKFLKRSANICTGFELDSTPRCGDAELTAQDLKLHRAAGVGDVPAMCEALARGAHVNRSNSGDERRTPLIVAAGGGFLTACEFLLQNGANIDHRDARGQAAIHRATEGGHTGPVCVLLKRGANQFAVDERGQDPLRIAVRQTNADIVTLLRLARMNEEMRDTEGGAGHTADDETFQDIFRDFSRLASQDPGKLSRRQFDSGGT